MSPPRDINTVIVGGEHPWACECWVCTDKLERRDAATRRALESLDAWMRREADRAEVTCSCKGRCAS